jgi:hypothetical protein
MPSTLSSTLFPLERPSSTLVEGFTETPRTLSRPRKLCTFHRMRSPVLNLVITYDSFLFSKTRQRMYEVRTKQRIYFSSSNHLRSFHQLAFRHCGGSSQKAHRIVIIICCYNKQWTLFTWNYSRPLHTRAQHFPSNLYPYLDHTHQQRPMSTHAHP